MRKQGNYILFIDESGKSKLSDDHTDFLLSGLVIDRDLHAALSSYMVSLKEKSAIPTDQNIHAFDLFEGEREKVFDADGRAVKNRDGTHFHKRIPHARIEVFFKRLTGLIEGADSHCFVYRVNKDHFRKRIEKTALGHGVPSRYVTDFIKRKGLNDFLYESLARRLILDFGHFLEEMDSFGEVMAESRRQEDSAVLAAFIAASQKQKFERAPRYQAWSRSCMNRIHSLTFQNKRGLSFGLEVADLFGWAHFNKMHGRKFPLSSAAKIRRVEARINRTDALMQSLYKKKKAEEISVSMLESIAHDRVSEFAAALREYRPPSATSGTQPSIPGGP